MNIANVRIGTRLGVGFGLILVLLAGIASLGLRGMSSTNDALNNIVDNNVAKMDLLSEMSESIHIVATGIRTVVLLSSDDAINAEIKKIEAAAQSLLDQAKDLAETVSIIKIDDTSSAQITKLSISPIRKIAFAQNDLPRAA